MMGWQLSWCPADGSKQGLAPLLYTPEMNGGMRPDTDSDSIGACSPTNAKLPAICTAGFADRSSAHGRSSRPAITRRLAAWWLRSRRLHSIARGRAFAVEVAEGRGSVRDPRGRGR